MTTSAERTASEPVAVPPTPIAFAVRPEDQHVLSPDCRGICTKVYEAHAVDAYVAYLAAELATARRTAQHWKDEHLAGNAEIERLTAELAEARENVTQFTDYLEKRAKWLDSEIRYGGNLEHLSARFHECRGTISKVREYFGEVDLRGAP